MRDSFPELLALDPQPARTAALVQWVQRLYPSLRDKPVLVGGSAVELYTQGAYVTGDIDLVGTVPGRIAAILKNEGFQKEGRHWIHEEGRVFLEFTSSSLAGKEKAVHRSFDGRDIRIVSPEDLIVDRLSAWVHWGSAIDGVNAYLVYRSVVRELGESRLRVRAAQESVLPALEAVVSLFRREEGRIPGREEFEEWARKIPGG